MKFLIFYDGNGDDCGQSQMVGELVRVNIGKEHTAFLYNYNNLPNISALLNLRNSPDTTSILKHVAVQLLNYVNTSDAILYLSCNINFQNQIPEELLDLLKIGFKKDVTLTSRRWNLFGVSCFVIGNRSSRAAKTIWTTFRQVELSSSCRYFDRPLYVEDRSVEETPVPSCW